MTTNTLASNYPNNAYPIGPAIEASIRLISEAIRGCTTNPLLPAALQHLKSVHEKVAILWTPADN
jgi:hypothetical protein